MRAADVRTSARRVAFAQAVFVLAFASLGVRAAHLSVFDHRGAERGEAQTLRTLTLAPERGSILDRNGTGLALTVEAPSVYVIGRDVTDPVATARVLGSVLGVDRATLLSRLKSRDGFQFVERWVSAEQAERIAAAHQAGVGLVQEPRRIYPHHGLAASLIGFANIDGEGARGIEQQEDAWLRGTTRRLPVERDGTGRFLVMDGETTWGTAGGDVALTLDAALQADAERALAQAIQRTGARGGLVLAMDPYTGEVLSLAESPSFDPNRFRRTAYEDTGSAAFLDAVEPGSSMKAFLVAAALERGAISPHEIIDTEEGRLHVPGKTITDHRDYGPLDPAGVLRVSSNVAAVKIGQALGPEAHYEMLRAFGFGESTGSLFPDESSGLLRTWRNWKPVDHATIAFGQGISVTTVQLAAAASALANGGLLMRPRLVAARRAPGGPWQPTRPEVVRRVIHRETAEQVLAMLETVVEEDGTGRRAELPGVRVAGKTGTAQKWDSETNTYSQSKFRAWFVGIAPADAPRIVVVSQLDEPERPFHTGGMAAAPLFADVAVGQLAHQGIFLDRDAVQVARKPASAVVAEAKRAESQELHHAVAAQVASAEATTRTAPPASARPTAPAPTVAAAPPPSPAATGASSRPEAPASTLEITAFGDRVLLPDFRGLSKSEVIQVTAANGLRVTLSGDGLAVRQDPPPGSVVAAGSETVRIEFSAGEPTGAAGVAPGGRG